MLGIKMSVYTKIIKILAIVVICTGLYIAIFTDLLETYPPTRWIFMFFGSIICISNIIRDIKNKQFPYPK